MSFVTISDHNTVEGALRIAHEPDTFRSRCTPRLGLSEKDHRDLQPYRPSVHELVAFLRERSLVHALADPLYRMSRRSRPRTWSGLLDLRGGHKWMLADSARLSRAVSG